MKQTRGGTLLLCLAAMAAGYFFANRGWESFSASDEAVVDFETMNTYGRIRVPKGSGAEGNADETAAAALAAVQRVNELMSPFGETSDVRRLNDAKAGEWVAVDPLTWTVVMEALRWHRLSGGAFDPTIGPVKQLFTFDKSEAAAWPDEAVLSEAQARVGADKLLFEREGMRLAWAADGMRLDLGAIAKGFAADCAADVLRRHGVRNALVDIGGELRVLGMKPSDDSSLPPSPWRAGVKDPRGDDVVETLDLSDAGVATSGDYERYFTYKGKRYEHIIDPRTGLPLTGGVSSVTAASPGSCLAADALATTIGVLGADEGEKFLRRQALGLFTDGVRVILYQEDNNRDGNSEKSAWRRIELTVEPGGDVRREESLRE